MHAPSSPFTQGQSADDWPDYLESFDKQTRHQSETEVVGSRNFGVATTTTTTTKTPLSLLRRFDGMKNLSETNSQNKRLLGLALLILIGLALIPFTGGTSLVTLIPGLTALIPPMVGISVGSGLCGIGLVLLFQEFSAPPYPRQLPVRSDDDPRSNALNGGEPDLSDLDIELSDSQINTTGNTYALRRSDSDSDSDFDSDSDSDSDSDFDLDSGSGSGSGSGSDFDLDSDRSRYYFSRCGNQHHHKSGQYYSTPNPRAETANDDQISLHSDDQEKVDFDLNEVSFGTPISPAVQ